jgi:transporter family-2 protein
MHQRGEPANRALREGAWQGQAGITLRGSAAPSAEQGLVHSSGGTALIALLIAIPVTGVTGFAPSKAAQVPWWAWLGGLLSIMSTMAGLMLARKMGSTYFTATTVTCSLVSAVLLDHMGWIGFEVHHINLWRMVGCALLLAGVFLVSKF